MRNRYAAAARVMGWGAAALLCLASCGAGDGLRVEGPVQSPETPLVKPSQKRSTATRADEIRPLGAPSLKRVLLADDDVADDIRSLIRTCAWGCVKPGPLVPAAGKDLPQQVVTVTTADGSAFMVYLIGDLATRPRVVWYLEGDYMKVSIGKGSTLVVESRVYGANDRACCPTGSRVGIYHWNGYRMVQISEQYQPSS
jgi:hypothetical protein